MNHENQSEWESAIHSAWNTWRLRLHGGHFPWQQELRFEKRDNTHLHMSDSGKCLRQRMLKLTGASQMDRPPDRAGTMIRGYIYERMFVSAMEQRFGVDYKQDSVNNGHEHGHPDGALVEVGREGILPFDVKSTTRFHLKHVDGGQEDEGYCLQLSKYAACMEADGKVLDGAALMYVLVEDTSLHIRWVDLEKWGVQARVDTERVLRCQQDLPGLPAPLPFVDGKRGLTPHWNCRYCDYVPHCPEVARALGVPAAHVRRHFRDGPRVPP